MKKNILIICLMAIVIIAGVLWKQRTPIKPEQMTSPIPTSAIPSSLPGLQTNNAPWPAETDHLQERLTAINLPALATEGTALHTHEHLDIFIDGKPVSIPTNIGIDPNQTFIAPIHTHDATAVIHVESPTIQKFTLGQFFDIWGVRLSSQCIGGYCASGNKKVKVFVNGNNYTLNPRNLELSEHQEIVITYGAPGELPKVIPTSYQFASGL